MVGRGQLTLGTNNGSQFTSRDFRRRLSARGVTHRRGGDRDPESQASGLGYPTPTEVAQTWKDDQDLKTDAT
jgi:transposase InsO family protein